jgi:hypothetical protein
LLQTGREVLRLDTLEVSLSQKWGHCEKRGLSQLPRFLVYAWENFHITKVTRLGVGERGTLAQVFRVENGLMAEEKQLA